MHGDAGSGVGVVGRITESRADLPDALQRVADQVLRNPLEAAQLTLVDLAERSGTSPGTITRFCRVLGFDRYAHLKLALVADVNRTRTTDWRDEVGPRIDSSDPVDVLVSSIATQAATAVRDALDRVDRRALTACADALASARRVDLIGMGGSSPVATELQLRLHRIGTPSWAWTDPHNALASAALLQVGDVVVAVSGSGRSVECIEVVREARDHGATTVALTAEVGSPLAREASLVIETHAAVAGLRHGSVLRYAQLAVVDALYLAVVQRRNETVDESLNLTARAVLPRVVKDPASGR